MRKVLIFTLIVLMLTGFASAGLLEDVWSTGYTARDVAHLDADSGYSQTDYSTVGFSFMNVVNGITGDVWVPDRSNNVIRLYNASDSYSMTDYATGTYPQMVALDGDGDPWVVNRNSHTVSHFDISDGFTRTDYATGTSPRGVTVDLNGDVWVVSYSGDEVRHYNRSDGMATTDYAIGNQAGSITGIAIDLNNNVWVINLGDNDISLLDASSAYARTDYATPGNPRGIVTDSNNNVWVTDSTDVVNMFDAADSYSRTDYATGDLPTGVSIDKNDNIIVSNINDDDVSIFDAASAYARTDYAVAAYPYNPGTDFTGQRWFAKFGGGGDTPPVVSNAQLIASDDPMNSSNANLISSWDYSDAENESMIANQTIWYKDSVEQPSLENQSIISNTNTAVGESWQFKTRAQASNLVWSTYEFSNSLVILNNAPVMSALEIGPVPLYTSVNATAEAIYTDSEVDVGTVNFEWFINNVSSYSENVTGVSSGSKAESQLNFGLYNEGDVIYFKTFGTDGINDSAIETSSSLTVQATPVVATDGEVFNYLALLMAVLILVLSIAVCCIEDNFVKMMLLIPLNLIVLTAVHIGKLIVEEAYSSLTAVATVLDALFICLAVMIIPLTVILFCYVVYKIIDSIFNSRKKRDNNWDKWQD
tara:strand:- start:4540 stop:6480 length:1941 start_codon:yes stop_codon:yes gene_type:complete